MKPDKTWASGLAFCALMVLVLASCAGTAPVSGLSVAAVEVRPAEEAEVRAVYGRTPAVNPFLPPSRITRNSRDGFLVVLFVAPAPLRLDIAGIKARKAGTGTAGTGTELDLSVLGRDELRRFWEARAVDDGSPASAADLQRKFAAIDRYALDLYRPNTLRKNSPYALVVRALPLEDTGSAELVVRYYVNGEYGESTFPMVFEAKRK